MALDTYAGIRAAVANYLDRTDLDGRIREFITLAEARFNRVIRAPDMLTRTDSFTVDSQYETLPTGFLEASRVVLLTSPVTVLEFLTPEEIAEVRNVHSSAGKPVYYSVSGGNFEFLPTPGQAYTASVLYYQRITAVSSSFNWLATSHPDIYLYGALLEAEPYIQNDERIPVWQSRLDRALAELNVMNERKKVPGAARPRTGGFE